MARAGWSTYFTSCSSAASIASGSRSYRRLRLATGFPASAPRCVRLASVPNEGMVALFPSSFAGHRLLMEYFAFPEKFFFIDLCGLQSVSAAGFKDAIEIIFLLSDIEGRRTGAAAGAGALEEDLSPGMFSVVNLFSQVASRSSSTSSRYAIYCHARTFAGPTRWRSSH